MGNETDNDIVDISEEIKEKPAKEVSVKEFRVQKKKGYKKIVIILLIIAAVVSFVVYKSIETKKKIEEALAGSKVQTAQIERRTISKAISTTGTIQSKDVRTLTSPLAGVKIDKVNYKVGDMVNEGAIVVAFSVDDINKKIGQLEEDITEAKQAKALDGGDRNNTYVNNYDLQTYSVANAYDKLQKMDVDLQKAKNDLQRACDEKAEFKSKYEEAKEKIDGKKEELEEKTVSYNLWKADGHPIPNNEEDLKEDYNRSTKISDLRTKISEYQSLIDGYDKTIETYESSERTAQNAVDTAQRNYDSAYVDFNKAGYDSGFSNAKTDYNYNKANLQANDNIKNLERQKEQNEDTLENYIVTAPITGLVTAVNAQEGNGYQANTGALMTIQAVDVFEVTTQVDEYDINNVRLGQKVAIMTDATGDDEIEGKVTFVAPTATVAQNTNSSTNTFEVKIDILNKDERLKLGMSAKLNILVDSHENVLSVPFDAIEQKEDGGMYIYVVSDDKKPDEKEDANTLDIQVIGTDGQSKNDDDVGSGFGTDTEFISRMNSAKKNAEEIKVTVGLEGDFYTEVSSPQIQEGMTVLVDSKAGELKNDMDMFMGI